MGDVVDVAFDDFNRCCNGCQIMMGGENNLHKTRETTNPNKMWNFGFWGLLKLEISLRFDKKYFSIIQGFQL